MKELSQGTARSIVVKSDIKRAHCLSNGVSSGSSENAQNRQPEKLKKARGSQLEKCGVARALQPIHAESSSNPASELSAHQMGSPGGAEVEGCTLQLDAREDSGTDDEGMKWETDLVSCSERPRSKLQQRHLYEERGASHMGSQRSCWANPFTVKQHGPHRAIEKFEEMLNRTPTLLKDL